MQCCQGVLITDGVLKRILKCKALHQIQVSYNFLLIYQLLRYIILKLIYVVHYLTRAAGVQTPPGDVFPQGVETFTIPPCMRYRMSPRFHDVLYPQGQVTT